MDFLREYILNITAVALCTSLCAIIIPSGSYGKYVRLVCGLVLAVVMIKPFALREGFAESFSSLISESTYYEENAKEQYVNIIAKAYKKRIEEDIKSQTGVLRAIANVKGNGEISKIYVYTKGTDLGTKEYVMEKYGLLEEQVFVIEEQGG